MLKTVKGMLKQPATIEKLGLGERGAHSLKPTRTLSTTHKQTFDIKLLLDRNFSQSQSYPNEGPNSTEEKTSSNEFSGDEFSKKSKEDKINEEKETKQDDDDERIKHSILSESLKFVPGYGWSKQAIEAGTESLGYPTVTSGVIDDPSISLIHHHYQASNNALEKIMQKEIEELTKSGQEINTQ